MKRIVSLLAMLAMVALAAAPALAQGPPDTPGVESGTDHAHSICSFSGLNDFDPEEEPPYDTKVQSYGQLVQQGYKDTEFAPSPGLLCNPNTGPEGPFTEDVE
jgi:hypothetical protein